MTTQNRNLPPFVIVLIVLGALGLGFKVVPGLFNRLGSSIDNEAMNSLPVTQSSAQSSPADDISAGEAHLIDAVSSPEKTAGIRSYGQGDYATAITWFEQSLQHQRNDPETLVYLNNARAVTKNPISVAISLPISSNPNVSQEMLRGAAHAQDQINQRGGIHGRGLQLTLVDDRNDPAHAQTMAQTLSEDDSVVAVIGHNTSDVSLAVAPIYQDAGLVMISPTSTANNLSNFGTHIFRTLPPAQSMTQRLAQQVVASGSNILAICYDSQATAAVTFKEEFAVALAQAGGRVVPLVCDLSSPSFTATAAMEQVTASGADGLLMVPHRGSCC